jgi:hypothetical protein
MFLLGSGWLLRGATEAKQQTDREHRIGNFHLSLTR